MTTTLMSIIETKKRRKNPNSNVEQKRLVEGHMCMTHLHRI